MAGKARLQSMAWLVLPLQWSGSGKSKWEGLELEAIRPGPSVRSHNQSKLCHQLETKLSNTRAYGE